MRRLIPALIASLTILAVSIPFAVTQPATDAMAQMPMAQAQATDQLPPNPGCTPAVVPIGQANPPGSQLEPLDPIWCFNLAPPNPPTRVTGANDWVDNFDNVAQMGRFNDGDYDYRIFTAANGAGCSPFQTQHFTNNQHWMDDNTGAFTCGTMIRPNRSFTFENGKLVVEEDVAAGISGYQNTGSSGIVWPEIDISQGPQPTGKVVDNLYGYGQFGGYWTIGCRLHALRNPVCAVEDAASDITNTDDSVANCHATAPARVMEISDFEPCANATDIGGNAGGDNGNYWRVCDSAAQSPDMMCRDRFRIELTQSSLTIYVNGHLYFQSAGWPANRQLPASLLASGPWYVYATDWQGTTSTSTAFRFHWDNFAVNPHNADGTFKAPSAAPSFCLGQPNNTCASAMATNTPAPTLTQAPTNTAVSTSTSVATNTAVPTSTVAPSATATVGIGPMTCALNVAADGSVSGSCVKN